jgi:hypothetical protein
MKIMLVGCPKKNAKYDTSPEKIPVPNMIQNQSSSHRKLDCPQICNEVGRIRLQHRN